jgi:ribosomal protein S6--L-glutamate ligase
VGVKGGWSSELLAETVEKRTGYGLLVEMDKVRLDLDAETAYLNGLDLRELDALIIKKIGARYSPDLMDRLETLRFLNRQGLPMFSAPENIMRVLDRLSCTVGLRLAGIPMPPTTITESVDQALTAVEKYEEAVFKPLYTSKARGMTVISAGEGAREKIAEYRSNHKTMYIQKTIDLGPQDLGLVFLGGEYLTTYARRKQIGEWNTTTASGGKYGAFTPSDGVIALAKKAQEPFGLDFTCVDVALTPDGPMVFEVSAFGGFRGIQEACGMDAASLYVDFVLKRL